MNHKDIFIYLKKVNTEVFDLNENDDLSTVLKKYYQTPAEYTDSIKRNMDFLEKDMLYLQYQQLIDIAVTCRIIFQWIDYIDKKTSFTKVVASKEVFDELFDPQKWYIFHHDNKDKLLDSINENYKSISTVLFRNYRKYLIYKRRHIFISLFSKNHEIEFLNFLLNNSVYINLGLYTESGTPVKHKLFKNEFPDGIHDFINEGFSQLNMENKEACPHFNKADYKYFFPAVATKCMETYIHFWETVKKINSRHSKTDQVKKMTIEELKQTIIEYNNLPKHFFEILQNNKYEGDIILDENYKILYKYQSLVLSEIQYSRKDANREETKKADWAPIIQLFFGGKPPINIYSLDNSDNKKYEKRLRKFDDFIQKEN